MAKQYGPITSFYELNSLRILINDSYIAKKVLSNPNALDRPLLFSKSEYNPVSANDNTPSFFGLNGTKWHKMRQIMSSKLVNLLNTKYVNTTIIEFMQQEIEPALNKICSEENGIWYNRFQLITDITFNVVFTAQFGKSANFKQIPQGKKLKCNLSKLAPLASKKGLAFYFLPLWVSKMFIPKTYNAFYELRNKIHNNISDLINYRNNLDLVLKDSFMDHAAKIHNNLSQEIADIFAMFLAGTDGTSLTIEWGLFLLSKQINIQIKIRNELLKAGIKNASDLIGLDITLLRKIPLFRALIYEILRISCVGRLGQMHVAKKDIWINTRDGKKYCLPKGSSFWYNVEAIHYNVLNNENWKNNPNNDPQSIYLENWLNDKGQFKRNKSFLAFGHGKRDCVGKELAIKEIRIILAYLLLTYTFELKPEHKNTYIPTRALRNGGAPSIPNNIPFIIKRIDCINNNKRFKSLCPIQSVSNNVSFSLTASECDDNQVKIIKNNTPTISPVPSNSSDISYSFAVSDD
eukprot:1003163_1